MNQGEKVEITRRRSFRWKALLELGRVSNLPTVWTNVLAGMLLAGGPAESPVLLLTLLSMTFFYLGGMYLNDAFDHRRDRAIRPERPIPSGRISLRTVAALGSAFLLVGIGLLGAATRVSVAPPGPEVLVLGTALALLIVYYDYRHARDPLSPLVMALCRGLVYLTSAAAAGSAWNPEVLLGAAAVTGYLIGLTYAARQENLKEIGRLWPLLFLAFPFVTATALLPRLDVYSILYGLFFIWVLYSLSLMFRRQNRSIPAAVVFLIAGISLLDALMMGLVTTDPTWGVLALAGFASTLILQRFVAGT